MLQEMTKSAIAEIQNSAAFCFCNATEITTKEMYIASSKGVISLWHKWKGTQDVLLS